MPNEAGRVLEFLDELDSPSRVAFESTDNWPWLYDLLEGEGIETKLAHPQKVKAIASAKLKNDQVDSRILAQLLRTDLLPESYVPPLEIREWRELVRYRAALVRMQTALKNRLRALLAKRKRLFAIVTDARNRGEENHNVPNLTAGFFRGVTGLTSEEGELLPWVAVQPGIAMSRTAGRSL